ncbi:hypothetical protein CFP56_031487 [Quercus suber]|uniref:Uncharacterized protein n=1 Tax=Quercus suber TaxID=58331 RepID=A0AAW0LVU5_QUESU
MKIFYNILGKARATHSFLSEILLLPSANFVILSAYQLVWEAQNLGDHTKSGSSTRLLLICLAMLAWLPECHI